MSAKTEPVPIGAAVQRARQRLGWSPTDLATRAEVSVRYIHNIEANRKTPSLAVFKQLCIALAVSSDELLGLTRVVKMEKESRWMPAAMACLREPAMAGDYS